MSGMSLYSAIDAKSIEFSNKDQELSDTFSNWRRFKLLLYQTLTEFDVRTDARQWTPQSRTLKSAIDSNKDEAWNQVQYSIIYTMRGVRKQKITYRAQYENDRSI